MLALLQQLLFILKDDIVYRFVFSLELLISWERNKMRDLPHLMRQPRSQDPNNFELYGRITEVAASKFLKPVMKPVHTVVLSL
jgi:hypothetical protein